MIWALGCKVCIQDLARSLCCVLGQEHCVSPHPQEYKWVMGIGKLSGKLGKMLEERGGGGFHATETGMSFTSLLAQEHPLPCPIIKSIL